VISPDDFRHVLSHFATGVTIVTTCDAEQRPTGLTAFRMGEIGVPLIEQALACLECRTVSAHVEGDHTIFVGRVESVHVGEGEPLLYYRGKYHRLRGDHP
jgi:flavin reductase (DIM6/NTAB) family NADH-FMN oxidoreductase RutF